MLKLDFYRVLHRKRILFGVAVIALFCYMAAPFSTAAIPENQRSLFPLNSAFDLWAPMRGGGSVIIFSALCYLAIGVLVSDLFYEDAHARLINTLGKGCTARQIATAHYITAFCIGALFVLIGLIAEIMTVFAIAPMLPISQYYIPPLMSASIFMPELYLQAPFVYIVVTVLRCALLGGLLGCTTLSFGYLLGGAYSGVVVPLFLFRVIGYAWAVMRAFLPLPRIGFFDNFPIEIGAYGAGEYLTLAALIGFCIFAYIRASRSKDIL